MNRINTAFNNTSAFIAYLTAGYKGMSFTYDAVMALIEGGVNLLEIGIPFSDPVADGPTIQLAASESIKSGTNIKSVLKLVKNIRKNSEVPIILFSYLNPILSANNNNFIKQVKDSGVDGILLVDLPMEESEKLFTECYKAKVDPIYVISPSTDLKRIEQINKISRGFLYYACRKGTTGVRSDLPEGFGDKMLEIKSLSTLPVVAGFGIASKESASKVLQHADGFVVGSLFVKAITDGATPDDLKQLATKIDPR